MGGMRFFGGVSVVCVLGCAAHESGRGGRGGVEKQGLGFFGVSCCGGGGGARGVGGGVSSSSLSLKTTTAQAPPQAQTRA